MTREEAIAILQDKYDCCKSFYDLAAHPEEDYPEMAKYLQALQIALSALRPVSREQIEKVWRGEWLHDLETGYEHCDKCSHTISLDDYMNRKPPLFCEMCGDAKTDEAVEMVMERLEALYETI